MKIVASQKSLVQEPFSIQIFPGLKTPQGPRTIYLSQDDEGGKNSVRYS